MPIIADIYYHVYHEEETLPLVLIHGAGGNHLYWPPEVRRLPGIRVYALDLPGHGKSTGRGQQTIEGYAQSVEKWMVAADLPRAFVAGHSMGGAIAMMLALDMPDRVLGLGLLGSGARLNVNPSLLEAASSPTTLHNAVEKVIAWSFSPETPDRLKELAAQRMLATRPTVLHSDFLACDAFDLSERVMNITQPTLILCGDEDKMTPLRSAQFLADQIPNARLEILPGAGHMAMIEQPADVAARLRDFFSQITYG